MKRVDGDDDDDGVDEGSQLTPNLGLSEEVFAEGSTAPADTIEAAEPLEAEADAEPVSEAEAEPVAGAEVEPVAEVEAEAEPVAEAEAEPAAEAEPQPDEPEETA
jgi:hypothetical protein